MSPAFAPWALVAWALLTADAALASNIPFRPEAAEGPSGGQWGLAVGLCIALLWLAVVALRKGWLKRFGIEGWAARNVMSGDEAKRSGLRIVETVRVGPQTRLATVEFGDQVLLLSVTSQGATLLSSRPKDSP